MAERPILFSAPMVRAILAGTKTQTRRAVKSFKHFVEGVGAERDCIKDKDGLPSRLDMAPDNWECCPYGVAGDRLWVRETGWERPERSARDMREGADTWAPYYFDADLREADGADHEQLKEWGFKRRPSIFMPRWASRITLEVVRVRVERLNDIGQGDACAEGAPPPYEPLGWYQLLWEEINGKGSWAANPWVWCVEFKRVLT